MKFFCSLLFVLFFAGCASQQSEARNYSDTPPRYVIGTGSWSHEVTCNQGRYSVLLRNNQKDASQNEYDQACRDALPQARRGLEVVPKYIQSKVDLIVQQPVFNRPVCASNLNNAAVLLGFDGRSWNGFVWTSFHNGGCNNGLSPYLYGQNGFVNYDPPIQNHINGLVGQPCPSGMFWGSRGCSWGPN